MPDITFYDGLHDYAADTDMSARWSLPASAGRIAMTTLGRASGPSFRPGLGSGMAAIASILPESTQKFGVQFRIRGTSVGNTPAFFAAGSLARAAVYRDVNGTFSAGSYFKGTDVADLLSLRLSSGRQVELCHAVQTDGTASALMSTLVVGTSATALTTSSQLYHVELVADLSTADARILLYIDGQLEIDATINRDRVAPVAGQSVDRIEYFAFSGTHTTAASNPSFSDVIAYSYSPEEALAGMGPLAVDTVYPAGLGNPSGTGVTVASGSSVIRDIDSGAVTTGEVYAARLTLRTTQGQVDTPYRARLGLIDGESEIAHIDTDRVETASPVIRSVDISDLATTVEAMLGMQLNIEAL
ncbi:hypothetical protein LOS78_12755 [Paracoccus sp. MA]|uniref:hypothetical protein n=1 Tax=Paracoccus sp. MA TaxID=2895796 RepID=UPI001E4E419D|nr:hypothetical protein [Paracoccus sp. MA]UFM66796.1 hypothetical protein LOS78_12755 [Paracoccus sp. MA]